MKVSALGKSCRNILFPLSLNEVQKIINDNRIKQRNFHQIFQPSRCFLIGCCDASRKSFNIPGCWHVRWKALHRLCRLRCRRGMDGRLWTLLAHHQTCWPTRSQLLTMRLFLKESWQWGFLFRSISQLLLPFSSTTIPDFWMMLETFNRPSDFPPRANKGNVALVSKMSVIPSYHAHKSLMHKLSACRISYLFNNFVKIYWWVEFELWQHNMNLYKSTNA